MDYKAPFPWFGGKSQVAHVLWERFGDVANYVEPFFGSGAVLFLRPTMPKVETVNDKDCFLANFWRAVKFAPDDVAEHATWPVNEVDLASRRDWLFAKKAELQEKLWRDPFVFDAQLAGIWV